MKPRSKTRKYAIECIAIDGIDKSGCRTSANGLTIKQNVRIMKGARTMRVMGCMLTKTPYFGMNGQE